jgi:hypothetical protein
MVETSLGATTTLSTQHGGTSFPNVRLFSFIPFKQTILMINVSEMDIDPALVEVIPNPIQ